MRGNEGMNSGAEKVAPSNLHSKDECLSYRHILKWGNLLLVVIILLAVALRMIGADYNLDGDEVFSVKLASKPFTHMISAALKDKPHPPLHYITLHFWIKLFGNSEWSVRGLSILCSGLFIMVAYALLRPLLEQWLTLCLLLIFAISPMFVYYGQQARPYAVIALLSACNMLSFSHFLQADDRKRGALWSLSCAVLLHAQYMAILIITTEILITFLAKRSKGYAACFYGCIGSVLILPWAMAAMGPSVLKGTDSLSQISWISRPAFSDYIWFYVNIFGDCPFLQARWLLLLLALPLAAYAWRCVASWSLPLRQLFFFAVGGGVPTLVFAISAWGPKPVFAPRQLIGAAVAVIVGLGLCLHVLPRFIAIGVLTGLLAWTITALPQAFPHNQKPPWRAIARHVEKRHESVEVVAQEEWVRRPLDFYMNRNPVRRWNALKRTEQDNAFLFVCRPSGSRCSCMEKKLSPSRRRLLHTWKWGKNGELRLYKVTAKR